MPSVTFGDVKADLMLCVENGLSDSTDPRIRTQTNAAMRALARGMPSGVFVGSTAVLQVPVDSQGTFALPSGYDRALAIESDTEGTQEPAGWYNLLSRATFVSPEDLIGTAFYDLGQDPTTGIRTYRAPNLPSGVTSLTVSALKSFVSIVDDTTPLYVQNVEAIRLYLLSLFMQLRASQRDLAKAYQADAIAELTNELQRHLDDPSLYAARMAQYQYDAIYLADGTLGNFAARMALDFASGQKIGRVDLYRVVNEASRRAVEIYNDFGKTELWSNNAGPESISYVPATTRVSPLSYPDYEVLTLLVRAQGPGTQPEQIPELNNQAAKLIQRNLATKVVAARNVTWQGLISSNPQPQFGGMRAQLGLELGSGTDAYTYSDRFVSRLVRQAWAQAVDQYNLLSRTEDYEQVALSYPASIPADSDVVPFPIEVIKLYFEALTLQDANNERAVTYKQQAAALIQRNLVSTVERQRRTLAETQVLMDEGTFGYVKGRLALDLPDGLTMSDAKRGRLINQAEEPLCNAGRWKFMEAEYTLAVSTTGEVVVPADVERVVYAEQCGWPLELKDRPWFYRGCLTRQGNGWYGLGGCTWDISGQSAPMIYGGQDDCGNTHYTIPGCGWSNGQTRPAIRALCRRKWVLKQFDEDTMLIQNYPAIKDMASALLASDAGTSQYLRNSAAKKLDDQLAVVTDGLTPSININVPGVALGGGRGRTTVRANRYY